MGARQNPATLELVTLLADAEMPVHDAKSVGCWEMPSLGSWNHESGQCNPCAFFWEENGCSNAKSCEFCHLCDAGAKKRRQKAKKASLRAHAESKSKHSSGCFP